MVQARILKIFSDLDKYLNFEMESQSRRLARALSLVENRIINLLGSLSVDKNGNMKGSKVSIKMANQIHVEIAKEFEKEFGSAVSSVLEKRRAFVSKISGFFSDLEIPNSFSAVTKSMLKALTEQDFIVYKTLSQETTNRIAQSIYDGVIGGQKFSQTVRSIRAAITGYEDVAGRPLTQYAQTYAQDSLMRYYATIQKQSADDGGLTDFMYVGDVIKTTRPFCKSHAGKIYSREEIDELDKQTWQGKSGSVWVSRGGYNCRHHWVAVKKEFVESDEK